MENIRNQLADGEKTRFKQLMEENNSLQMKITYSETQIKSLEKNIESNENELNYFRKYKEKIERFDDVIQENN